LAELRKGHDEIRFRSAPNLDTVALAKAISMVASQVGHDEYVIDAPPHPKLMAQLTAWLADQGHPLTDLRAGAQRLEDVFRRLTADRAASVDDGPPAAAPDTHGRRRKRGRS